MCLVSWNYFASDVYVCLCVCVCVYVWAGVWVAELFKRIGGQGGGAGGDLFCLQDIYTKQFIIVISVSIK